MFTREQGRERETGVGAAILGLLLILVVFSAKAGGLKLPEFTESSFLVEVAIGQNRYDRAPAGMWWQPDQNNQNIFKDNGARQLRVGVKLNSAFNFYLGAVNLGRAHTRATAVTADNDDATRRDFTKDVNRPECQEGFKADCRYHWVGAGGATRAVSATVGFKLVEANPFTLEVEGGLLLYRMVWTETVCPNDCSTNDTWRLQVAQHTGYYLSPIVGARVHVDRCFGVLPKASTCFAGTYFIPRISDHLPISAGVGKQDQMWMAGLQVTL